MPTFDPDLAGALQSLQRQIDQINTSPPGPVSYGPGDHARFYASDGSTVLFEAVGGAGASVVSRGSLSGLTGLVDGIRDKNDAQDGTLDQHGSRISSTEGRVGVAEGRIDTLHSRQNAADQLNATQNGQLSQLRADLTGESSRIDNRATIGQLDATNTRVTNVEARNTAQDGRLDTLHSRANSQDTLNANQNGRLSQLEVDNNNQDGRLASHATQLENLRDGKASVASVNAAHDRADAAFSRAGTGISDAAAARALASDALVAANDAKRHAASIDTWLRKHTGYPTGGLNPNS